jgi:hypothetical protein
VPLYERNSASGEDQALSPYGQVPVENAETYLASPVSFGGSTLNVDGCPPPVDPVGTCPRCCSFGSLPCGCNMPWPDELDAPLSPDLEYAISEMLWELLRVIRACARSDGPVNVSARVTPGQPIAGASECGRVTWFPECTFCGVRSCACLKKRACEHLSCGAAELESVVRAAWIAARLRAGLSPDLTPPTDAPLIRCGGERDSGRGEGWARGGEVAAVVLADARSVRRGRRLASCLCGALLLLSSVRRCSQ